MRIYVQENLFPPSRGGRAKLPVFQVTAANSDSIPGWKGRGNKDSFQYWALYQIPD